MIKSIITERIINKQYIQRSKLFIYPFLYIPKDSILHPEQTYIGWIHNGREVIQSTDKKLICIFNKMTNSDQRKEEKKYLLLNRYFEDLHVLDDDKIMYVFNIKRINIEWEWKVFLNGEYSKLTKVAKKTITDYYSDSEYSKFIDSYLYPEEYYEIYAEALDIPLESIDGSELLSKPDISKETFIN